MEETYVILQSAAITLEIATANINELTSEMESLKEQWPALLSEAKLVVNNLDIPAELRQERRKRRVREPHAEGDGDANPEVKFKRNVFLVIMDSLISELKHRFDNMKQMCTLFSPLLNFQKMNGIEIRKHCKLLREKYPDDLTAALDNEIMHLKIVYNATFADSVSGPLALLNVIYKLQLEGIFGEVCTGLRIFRTLPITVAEGERAFSKLAIIKNYMRTTMLQERLNSLGLLSIEHDIL